MKSILKTVKRFLTNEQGLETVEYAVIAGLIVAAAVAGIAILAPGISDAFTKVVEKMS